MGMLKQALVKKQPSSKKHTREFQVLMGLVDLYLESGKPIGSNTLKEHGFDHLSSATIRNYFAELESQGFLRQPHSSGGRIPTHEALRLYASENLTASSDFTQELGDFFLDLAQTSTRHLTRYLQKAAERLSEVTQYATFLSSVRFDHDFILNVTLVSIDTERLLAVMLTDFGQVLTEILPIRQKVSSFALKRIEAYLQWRIKGNSPQPPNLSLEEESLAQSLYNEMMVRYIVRYSNFTDEELFRTGFSQLLAYSELSDPVALTTTLSLFENPQQMRQLLNDCVNEGALRFWIGADLAPYAASAQGCSVIAIPYYIGQMKVGAVGLLGPCRMPYKKLFASLRAFSESISKALTHGLLKYKLSFRQPRASGPYLPPEERAIVDQQSQKLIEIKDQS